MSKTNQFIIRLASYTKIGGLQRKKNWTKHVSYSFSNGIARSSLKGAPLGIVA